MASHLEFFYYGGESLERKSYLFNERDMESVEVAQNGDENYIMCILGALKRRLMYVASPWILSKLGEG